MCYQEKDDEFNNYRSLYIKCVSQQVFPWEPAYYYYMQNIDRIDVLSLEDFQDELLTISSMCEDNQAAFDKVTLPIYEVLDQYYAVNQVITADNKVIALF